MMQVTLNTILSVTNIQSSITPHSIHSKCKARPHPQQAECQTWEVFFSTLTLLHRWVSKEQHHLPSDSWLQHYLQGCLTPWQLCWDHAEATALKLTTINSLFSYISPSSISMIDTKHMDSRHGNKIGLVKTGVVAIVNTQMIRWFFSVWMQGRGERRKRKK